MSRQTKALLKQNVDKDVWRHMASAGTNVFVWQINSVLYPVFHMINSAKTKVITW